jgi:hypothetical protein
MVCQIIRNDEQDIHLLGRNNWRGREDAYQCRQQQSQHEMPSAMGECVQQLSVSAVPGRLADVP